MLKPSPLINNTLANLEMHSSVQNPSSRQCCHPLNEDNLTVLSSIYFIAFSCFSIVRLIVVTHLTASKGNANCELPAVMNPSVVFAKPVSKSIPHDLEEASGIMSLLGAAIRKGQMFLPTPSVGRPYTFVEYHRLGTQRRLWCHQPPSDIEGQRCKTWRCTRRMGWDLALCQWQEACLLECRKS